MDGQGLAGRGGAREPSSRTNRLHPLHPARTSRPDAGHVAAPLPNRKLAEHLRQREAEALIVSGSETDVCVLATVLDAVDIGYRIICRARRGMQLV